MRDHAVQALVGGGSGHHDHLALALGQAAGFAQHQRVVVGEEGAALVGPMGQREEDVGHEAGLFLHGEDALADIPGDVRELGHGKAANGRVAGRRDGCHGVS